MFDTARFLFTGDPAAYARMTGRPWWSLKYVDGTILHEYQRDWLDTPPRGRQALRLYCPDGAVAQVGDTADATGRLLQFKRGEMSTSRGHRTLAHVIGLVTGTDGQCTLYAYEFGRGLVGPLLDNTNHLAYGHVGPLCAAHLGIGAGEGA